MVFFNLKEPDEQVFYTDEITFFPLIDQIILAPSVVFVVVVSVSLFYLILSGSSTVIVQV